MFDQNPAIMSDEFVLESKHCLCVSLNTCQIAYSPDTVAVAVGKSDRPPG
jgi:hypothetical protein